MPPGCARDLIELTGQSKTHWISRDSWGERAGGEENPDMAMTLGSVKVTECRCRQSIISRWSMSESRRHRTYR
jgi:hypothetical protein